MQGILLDTHILIWLAQEPEKLYKKAYSYFNSRDKIFISHVSIWEIAIKIKTGKLILQFEIEEFIDKAVQKHALEFLPISLPHLYKTLELPLHHRDPFDRLLIAQSLVENLPVISSDDVFDSYIVNRIW